MIEESESQCLNLFLFVAGPSTYPAELPKTFDYLQEEAAIYDQ